MPWDLRARCKRSGQGARLGGWWQEVMAEMGKRPNLKYIVDTKPVRQRWHSQKVKCGINVSLYLYLQLQPSILKWGYFKTAQVHDQGAGRLSIWWVCSSDDASVLIWWMGKRAPSIGHWFCSQEPCPGAPPIETNTLGIRFQHVPCGKTLFSSMRSSNSTSCCTPTIPTAGTQAGI